MSLSNLERTFIDRITISRLERTPDNFGGDSTVEAVKYRNIPARIYGTSGNFERTVAGQTLRATMKMMVAQDQNINVGDIITAQDGNKYLCIWIRNYRDMSAGHHITVELATYSETRLKD
jgi:SPP1 family predicted phage head-tail adaptor